MDALYFTTLPSMVCTMRLTHSWRTMQMPTQKTRYVYWNVVRNCDDSFRFEMGWSLEHVNLHAVSVWKLCKHVAPADSRETRSSDRSIKSRYDVNFNVVGTYTITIFNKLAICIFVFHVPKTCFILCELSLGVPD